MTTGRLTAGAPPADARRVAAPAHPGVGLFHFILKLLTKSPQLLTESLQLLCLILSMLITPSFYIYYKFSEDLFYFSFEAKRFSPTFLFHLNSNLIKVILAVLLKLTLIF